MKPKILAFAGSARTDSFNKKLLRLALAGAQAAGGEVTLIDLRDYPMPIMDQDLEEREGQPENAQKLKSLFLDHQGLLLASPEYNSSYSPLFKNVIDWVSRPQKGEAQVIRCWFCTASNSSLIVPIANPKEITPNPIPIRQFQTRL